ncbi:hypothetical protein A5667_24935 [Mycolicibacterium fortuitum]|nr:hypothetical protein A5667_24935 [Mycolicibacterium fortuitum]
MQGDDADLGLLARFFGDGDPRVVQEEDGYYLAATDIDSPPGNTPYYEVARTHLIAINGLGRLIDPGFVPVHLTGNYQDGDVVNCVISVPPAIATARFGIPTVTVTNPDGTVVHGPPSAWPARLGLAESNADVAEVLVIVGRAEALGWVELYKVHEIIRESVKPAKIPDLGWADKATDSAFTGSANLPGVSGSDARHARMEGAPKRTMTIEQGRAYISDLVTKWLDHLASP